MTNLEDEIETDYEYEKHIESLNKCDVCKTYVHDENIKELNIEGIYHNICDHCAENIDNIIHCGCCNELIIKDSVEYYICEHCGTIFDENE